MLHWQRWWVLFQIEWNLKYICCFSGKYLSLRNKSKDCLVRCYQDTTRLLASRHCSPGKLVRTLKTHLGVLIFYNADIITISSKSNLFSPRCSWDVADLALNNNQSLTRYRSQKWRLTFFLYFFCRYKDKVILRKEKMKSTQIKLAFFIFTFIAIVSIT